MNFILSNLIQINLLCLVFPAAIAVFYDILKKPEEELRQEKLKEAESLTYYNIG